MITSVKLTSAEDLQKFVNLATACGDDIGVHAKDGKIADAKSILGLMALNYSEPVLVVTENKRFLKRIRNWVIE